MKKRFVHYDAQGTDGSDDSLLLSVFEVLDDDGFTSVVRLTLEQADGGEKEDAALREAIGRKMGVEIVGGETDA